MLPTISPKAASTPPRIRLVARLAIAAGAGFCALALLSWSAHAADRQRDGHEISASQTLSQAWPRDARFQ